MTKQAAIRSVCRCCSAVLKPSVEPTFDKLIQNEPGRRALEVALVGRHEIAFVGNNDAAQVLAEIARWHGVTSFHLLPCPCGNYGDADLACVCTPAMIARYRKARHYQSMMGADLYIETQRPDPQRMVAKYSTSLESVLERVAEAQNFLDSIHRPAGFDDLRSDSRSLMVAAIRQLHLDTLQIQSILRVSHSIAALAYASAVTTNGTLSIMPSAIAEALQYRLRTEYRAPATSTTRTQE